jgi:hypothetical protein
MKARIIVISGIISVLLLLLSRFKVYSLIAIAIFIAWTAYCIIQHNIRLHRRKEITARALASVHSWIFALVCAAAGTFSIMSKSDTLSISCDQVRWAVNQHLNSVLIPLRFTEEQIGTIKERVDKFFTATPEGIVQEQVLWQLSNNPVIADILPNNITQQLGAQWVEDLQKTVTDMLKSSGWEINLANIPLPANMSIKDKLMAKNLLKNAASNKQVPKLTIGQNTPQDAPQKSKLQTTTSPTTNNTSSDSLFNGFLSNSFNNKQSLDEKICDVVFGQIKEWSTKPGFKISILLSLLFFLYPLGRLIAFVYSIILTILYTILRKTWFISVIPEERIIDTWTIDDGYQPQTLLARMAFANTDKTPKAERVAKVVAAQEAARNATLPTVAPQSKQQASNVNEIFWGDNNGWWTGVWWDDHIIIPNSPQDTNQWEQPLQAKKDAGSHIDFGSFGWNFGNKFKN